MPTAGAECPKDEGRDDVLAWFKQRKRPTEARHTSEKVWSPRHSDYKMKRLSVALKADRKSAIHWAECVREQYESGRRAIRVFRWNARPRYESAAVRLFRKEADRWKNDTMHWSSMAKIVSHPSYLRIIGLGRRLKEGEIERLILRELEIEPYHWFDALEAITGQNPVRPEDDFDAAVNAWLDWGRREGVLANDNARGIER